MAKVRTTVTLDEDVFRAVKIKAARTGKRDSQVIEESLRRDLGVDNLAEIWAKVTPTAEEEGMDLATDELRKMRKDRPRRPQGPTQGRPRLP
jgi:gamma-glutamyl:cysteine ligase YbdK (ATP-grasp superfamily)